MSLKFGIYLVEQRIITPEQFCGLIKIQQESARALPTIALRKNLMTIRQVADVIDVISNEPHREFQIVATEMGYLHSKEADYLLQVQQNTAETIRSLAVECGLLTERQAAVLFLHFQKTSIKQPQRPAAPAPAKSEAQAGAPTIIETGSGQSGDPDAGDSPKTGTTRPKRPNFRRRPVIIEKEGSNA